MQCVGVSVGAPDAAVMQSHGSSSGPGRWRAHVSSDEDRAEQTDRWAKPSVVRGPQAPLGTWRSCCFRERGAELVLVGEECLVESWRVRGGPPGRASYEQPTNRKMLDLDETLHPARVHTS